jgi:hypothetical protein
MLFLANYILCTIFSCYHYHDEHAFILHTKRNFLLNFSKHITTYSLDIKCTYISSRCHCMFVDVHVLKSLSYLIVMVVVDCMNTRKKRESIEEVIFLPSFFFLLALLLQCMVKEKRERKISGIYYMNVARHH